MINFILELFPSLQVLDNGLRIITGFPNLKENGPNSKKQQQRVSIARWRQKSLRKRIKQTDCSASRKHKFLQSSGNKQPTPMSCKV